MMNLQSIENQLIKFLQEELKSIGAKKVVVGISGGLDSAVVAVLCAKAFGSQNVVGVLMPSHMSSDASAADAVELCDKFDISYETVEIAPMVRGYFDNNAKDANPLRIGNLSARMRMSVLYDISARDSAIVVGTSNKSEILLGYGTLYGDTACAINPIGQMYKSDEFEFAKFLGVTDAIINKKPSADLWEGQSDEEELGYSYATMDYVLKQIVDEDATKADLIAQGIENDLIEMLYYRMKANAFKGKLPTIANIDFKN
ncbi:MAG: NAD+ synthase [Campylobacteraceae bacterium]|nr:NAD+ synthase [Campylobacteraceae bacterium]MBT7274373.1 NAD+ synthase [Campylobacteraceae bacterium]